MIIYSVTFLFQECTRWFNADNCTDNGDWETISTVNGISPAVINCPLSYIIQGKDNNTILYNSAHELAVTGDRVTFNYKYPPNGLTGAGLICDHREYTWANNGPAQNCKDYSVRFCCPQSKFILNFDVSHKM